MMLCKKRGEQHLRAYLLLIWPIFLRILLMTLLGIANGILAKHLNDKNALTALELSRNFIDTPRFLFMGIANILSGIVIEADLTRHYQKSTAALKASFFIAILFLVPCTIILYCFSKPLLLYWEQPEKVVGLTSDYLPIAALALLPAAFTILIQRYLQGLGKTKTNMKMTLLQTCVSVFLSYVFMYGKFGLPPMGLIGSAVAFLTSQMLITCICLYQLIQLQRKRKTLFTFRSFTTINVAVLKHILLLGLFLGLSYGIRTAFNGAIMIVAGQLGASTQKVFSLMRTVQRPCYALIFSISIVGRILMNKYQHQPRQQRAISHFSYALVTAASLVIATGFYFGAVPFIRWMDKTATPPLLNNCQQMLPFEMLFIWIDGIVLLSISLLAGMKETAYPALVSFFTSFIIGLPLAKLLTNQFTLGLHGIYLALILASVINFIAMYARVRQKTTLWPNRTPHSGVRFQRRQ